jgi:hypothetical protein
MSSPLTAWSGSTKTPTSYVNNVIEPKTSWTNNDVRNPTLYARITKNDTLWAGFNKSLSIWLNTIKAAIVWAHDSKVAISWTGSTKTLVAWANGITKIPTLFTGYSKGITSWFLPEVLETPYAYDSSILLYDSGTRAYDSLYFLPSNQLNLLNPTEWSND